MADFLLQVRAGTGVMLTFVHFQETQFKKKSAITPLFVCDEPFYGPVTRNL